jgi:hypothetical protein
MPSRVDLGEHLAIGDFPVAARVDDGHRLVTTRADVLVHERVRRVHMAVIIAQGLPGRRRAERL